MRDVVSLITETVTQDSYGENISTKTSRQVYANKKSVRQSEFYAANAAGLKPSIVFEVFAGDYADEEFASYNGNEYRIVRTYQTSISKIELVCERY